MCRREPKCEQKGQNQIILTLVHSLYSAECTRNATEDASRQLERKLSERIYPIDACLRHRTPIYKSVGCCFAADANESKTKEKKLKSQRTRYTCVSLARRRRRRDAVAAKVESFDSSGVVSLCDVDVVSHSNCTVTENSRHQRSGE